MILACSAAAARQHILEVQLSQGKELRLSLENEEDLEMWFQVLQMLKGQSAEASPGPSLPAATTEYEIPLGTFIFVF